MCAAALSVVPTPATVRTGDPAAGGAEDMPADVVAKPATQQSALRLALRGVHFVPNHGQWSDAAVCYGFRSRGMDIAFGESALTMILRREVSIPACMLNDIAGTRLEQAA